MIPRKQILEQALSLPVEDRAYLLAALRASLSAACTIFSDAQFQQEMERRSGDSADTIPWSQVRDEL